MTFTPEGVGDVYVPPRAETGGEALRGRLGGLAAVRVHRVRGDVRGRGVLQAVHHRWREGWTVVVEAEGEGAEAEEILPGEDPRGRRGEERPGGRVERVEPQPAQKGRAARGFAGAGQQATWTGGGG